jgi:hypothetical protein
MYSSLGKSTSETFFSMSLLKFAGSLDSLEFVYLWAALKSGSPAGWLKENTSFLWLVPPILIPLACEI